MKYRVHEEPNSGVAMVDSDEAFDDAINVALIGDVPSALTRASINFSVSPFVMLSTKGKF